MAAGLNRRIFSMAAATRVWCGEARRAPFPGVEVSLSASDGTLFSAGHILMTDGRGMTRDRLTTRQTATVILNAGGTRYTFLVPVDRKPE